VRELIIAAVSAYDGTNSAHSHPIITSPISPPAPTPQTPPRQVASIPMKLTIKFPAQWKRFVALGERLALEASDPGSFYRPYFDSLPSMSDPAAQLTWESYPPDYLHLLQGAAPLAERVVSMQAATRRFWARQGLRLLEAGVTLERLRAALVTVRGWVRGWVGAKLRLVWDCVGSSGCRLLGL